MRVLTGLSVMLLCVFAVAVQAAEKDRLHLDDGTVVKGVVDSEGVDFIKVRIREDLPTRDYRPKDIERIEYAGMQSGAYAKGVTALESGNYEEAADAFGRVVDNAVREWQQVYGGYARGDALASMDDHGAAADAFMKVVEAAPKHKMWQEAAYRAGVALARSDRLDEAKAVAEQLDDYSKDLGGRTAGMLAEGVRAVVALAQDDFRGADKLARDVNRLRYKNAPEVWFHWNTLWAEALLAEGEVEDAVRQYTEMFRTLSVDPARRAAVSLELARALMKAGDDQGALVYFAYIDGMPFGTQATRTVAAYHSGRILLERAAAAADDERKEEDRQHAKVLLKAAVKGAGDEEAASKAAELLAKEFPEAKVEDDAAGS